MVRIAGALLIISTTSLLGVQAANRLKEAYQQMQYMQKILWQMKSRISYTRADLGDIFRQVSRELREPYRSWLHGIAQEMEKNSGKLISQIWREQTEKSLESSGLPKQEIQRIKQVGDCMGSADIELQIKNLELYISELEQSMNEMRPVIQGKVRVYHWLGVTGGVFISVILL